MHRHERLRVPLKRRLHNTYALLDAVGQHWSIIIIKCKMYAHIRLLCVCAAWCEWCETDCERIELGTIKWTEIFVYVYRNHRRWKARALPIINSSKWSDVFKRVRGGWAVVLHLHRMRTLTHRDTTRGNRTPKHTRATCVVSMIFFAECVL